MLYALKDKTLILYKFPAMCPFSQRHENGRETSPLRCVSPPLLCGTARPARATVLNRV